MAPFAQATIVEHLQFVGNDEWHDATTQTLLEHHETPHTAIAVLERMNLLEADMKVDNQVDAAEVVHRLHYIVHVQRLIAGHPYGVRLEDAARLLAKMRSNSVRIQPPAPTDAAPYPHAH